MDTPKNGVKRQDSLSHYYREEVPHEYQDLQLATTSEQFDQALAVIITDALSVLEKGKKFYCKDSEDKLTYTLIGFLNKTRILRVTQETYRNGRVDLTFEAELCRPKRNTIGEAKIYKDYARHKSGIEQLFTYCTGGEERLLLLVYVQAPSYMEKMESLRNRFDKELPYNQKGPSSTQVPLPSFETIHTLPSKREMKVWHMGCDLHYEKVVSR